MYSLHVLKTAYFHSVQANIAKYLHCRLEVADPLLYLFFKLAWRLSFTFLHSSSWFCP